MRATLGRDPRAGDYGAATVGVRRILEEWAEIDWFVAPGAPPHAADELFARHLALGSGFAPALFTETVDIRVASGGWDEFATWCRRVRTQSKQDWKFSVLKPLSNQHSRARGWSLQDQALAGQPDDLFVRVGEHVFWNLWSLGVLDLGGLDPEHSESAAFYSSYANLDLCECIEWQLAEADSDLAGNPFVPLVRCYGHGAYPFALGPDEVVLFRFDSDA